MMKLFYEYCTLFILNTLSIATIALVMMVVRPFGDWFKNIMEMRRMATLENKVDKIFERLDDITETLREKQDSSNK